MRLCRDLGQTLETVMNMSIPELQLWSAYYNIEQKNIRAARNRANAKRK
jgi:hypothetical protein